MSKSLRAQLKAEIKRTGVTALRLCRMHRGLPPSGLVNRWMKGIVFEACGADIEAVLAAYEALQTADVAVKPREGRRHEKANAPRIPVTAEMGRAIRAEFVRTGLTAELIAARVDAPQGLTARVIKGWVYGEVKTTRADHWEFVTRLFAQLPPPN